MNKKDFEIGRQLSLKLEGGYDASLLLTPTPILDEIIKAELDHGVVVKKAYNFELRGILSRLNEGV